MPTVAALLKRLQDDENPAVIDEAGTTTWRELYRQASVRAQLAWQAIPDGAAPNIGVLLPNSLEYILWLAASAIGGFTLVGLNTTRRGNYLAQDLRHTDCQAIVTSARTSMLLDGSDHNVPDSSIFRVESPQFKNALRSLDPEDVSVFARTPIDESTVYVLIFTSGTTGDPKACINTQGKIGGIAEMLRDYLKLSRHDIGYVVMPLFHSNAIQAGWGPALAAGSSMVVRQSFSASSFLPDVRRHSVTYFNYVGKPLSYILATPESPSDGENPLRLAFGNEANPEHIDRFAKRFNCKVLDAYGSTEGGITIQRTGKMPPGSIGRGNSRIRISNIDTGRTCAPAEFDNDGRLTNPEQAIGELVNSEGSQYFEGYWKNSDAEKLKTHGGEYHSGDLAAMDADGYIYLMGRTDDWVRVDGENIAVNPIEQIISRHPDVTVAAVYAVADDVVGDQIMACIQPRNSRKFDVSKLMGEIMLERDFSRKWLPRYVRIATEMPQTATGKVLRRQLKAEGRNTTDKTWWRPDGRRNEWQRFDAPMLLSAKVEVNDGV